MIHIPQKKIFTAIIFSLLAFSFTACTGISESLTPSVAAIDATVYNCSYFGYYDDVTTCENATDAACTYATQTYPNNTLGVCYFPPAGSEACASTPASWIYTTWGDWCQLPDETYQRDRSIISCSSSICACNEASVLQQNCTDSTDCAVPAASPNPFSASPTPPPCP
jgi:hypothetical protein